ncbi:MAG: 50S ribosomal protein L24 [Candidatus Magnetoglobus multicellularis str. Araruama]|uniref:Large ribosomal subunit protein uL24 n=1 Tax=Candidatus Magnetoglobus multicellularis str. Araruama TaxID=890399 RepID=A0A1V1PHX6_9BACT|nr:MAG: 50S ribosomal protein L24 [Candidatus Magnetoglobus multicellularis str. Araruama]
MLRKIKLTGKKNSHQRCHIRKGDMVKVIAGKDKGKSGRVLKIILKKDRAVVESVNMIKRHTKPTQANRQGGIIEKEAPIHWSNLMLECPKCVKPTRIQMQILDDKKKVRVCKKCNEIIDS